MVGGAASRLQWCQCVFPGRGDAPGPAGRVRLRVLEMSTTLSNLNDVNLTGTECLGRRPQPAGVPKQDKSNNVFGASSEATVSWRDLSQHDEDLIPANSRNTASGMRSDNNWSQTANVLIHSEHAKEQSSLSQKRKVCKALNNCGLTGLPHNSDHRHSKSHEGHSSCPLQGTANTQSANRQTM